MRYAITGATGLLGGNLAATLREADHEVVATRRGSSRTDHLDDLGLRWAEAGLDSVEQLRAAFEGCDAVFHCAAAVSIRFKAEPWIVEANVTGTANVIEAVQKANVRRLVHCSTVGAVGLSTDGEPIDETAEWNMADFGLADAYVSTKHEAELLVHKAVAGGLDAVVVNPTYMIGPRDVRPSSGKLVQELVLGKVPGWPDGKNNFVDVRDVARGMVAAAGRGRTGERYILGGHNMCYQEFMDLVCDTASVPRVKRHVPGWVGTLFGWGGDAWSAITGKEPLLNTATVRWADTDRFIFRSDKAIRELGYSISPLPPAILDAIAWFRAHKML